MCIEVGATVNAALWAFRQSGAAGCSEEDMQAPSTPVLPLATYTTHESSVHHNPQRPISRASAGRHPHAYRGGGACRTARVRQHWDTEVSRTWKVVLVVTPAAPAAPAAPALADLPRLLSLTRRRCEDTDPRCGSWAEAAECEASVAFELPPASYP